MSLEAQRATKEHLEKKEIWRKRCGRAGFSLRKLEEDGGGSTRQNWMNASSLWPGLKRQGLCEVGEPLTTTPPLKLMSGH